MRAVPFSSRGAKKEYINFREGDSALDAETIKGIFIAARYSQVLARLYIIPVHNLRVLPNLREYKCAREAERSLLAGAESIEQVVLL